MAIYGIPELTFQFGLDRFWREGAPPNAEVFDAFRRVVAARSQINGSFYSRDGLKLAVDGAVARLEACADQAFASDRTDDHLPAPSLSRRDDPTLDIDCRVRAP